MKKFILYILIISSPLAAVVGDWEAFGPALDWHDLQTDGESVYAATENGLLHLDADGHIDFIKVQDGLDHINLSAHYIDPAGALWVGYEADPAVITAMEPGQEAEHFDFDFSSITIFCGDDENTFAVYRQDMHSGIAHFVRTEGKLVFRDFYDQFDSRISKINDLLLFQDSLFVATDAGLWVADSRNPNLKPASAWTLLAGGGEVSSVDAVGEAIYFNLNTDLYRREGGAVIEETVNVGLFYPLETAVINDEIYMIYHKKIWRKDADEGWIILQSWDDIVNDLVPYRGQVLVALQQMGAVLVDRVGNELETFRPNSPLEGVWMALDYAEDHGLALVNGRGVSILNNEGYWHNIVRSDTVVAGSANTDPELFISDTIAFTYFGGGMYDMHISAAGQLFVSYSGVETDFINKRPINYTPVVKPGPLLRIDLGDVGNYTVYDTTDGMLDGSEASVAGSATYLVTRGIAEGEDGSIWIANAHASNGEPLLRLYPDGTFEKYSIDGSGGILQELPNEMVFDDHGRIWIANQYHPDNAPITDGGISIYDQGREQWFHISAARHGLANDDIQSMAKDPRDGSIWVVSPGGVQMIMPPSTVSSVSFDEKITAAIHSPLEGLSDLTMTKVRIDSRSNKWLLSSDGGIRIYLSNGTWHNGGFGYTRSNSPLLSNTVLDVVFDDSNAMAYILTTGGLNSVETGWGEKIRDTEDIIIFPQPFDSRVHRELYFDRLPEQSDIIIMSLNGTTLHHIKSNSASNFGRQVIWDFYEEGRPALKPGVYYAFIYNVNGLKKTLKFAVK